MPTRLQIGMSDESVNLDPTLGAVAHALTTAGFDIDAEPGGAAKSVEDFTNSQPSKNLWLDKRLSPMLPDRRRYRMTRGERPSIKSW